MSNNQFLQIYSSSWVYEKQMKIFLYEKRYNFETNKDFWFNISYKILYANEHIELKFQVFILGTKWEITRQRASWSGRAGPVHQWYWLYDQNEMFFFVSKPISKKINNYRDIALFESHIWLWKAALNYELVPHCSKDGVLECKRNSERQVLLINIKLSALSLLMEPVAVYETLSLH